MLKKCFITAAAIVVIAVIIAAIAEICREKIPAETEEEAVNIAKEVLGDDGTIEFAYEVLESGISWIVFSNCDRINHEYYEENYVGDDPFSPKSKRISFVVIRKEDGKIIERQTGPNDEGIYFYDPNTKNDN